MFGTSIHWTTFFYLLIDTFIVFFAIIQSTKLKHNNLDRYLVLGVLFILYNLTGGFLPFDDFPGPFILQYIITYGVAISMCIYIVYYLYKEYDINFLKFRLTIPNIAIYTIVCFIGLFLVPYFWTGSLGLSRILFALPIFLICLYFLWAFHNKISKANNSNPFIVRRNRLSLISVCCITLLPILTVIGDYQWLTFSVMNIAFFNITALEIDRYLYFLEYRDKLNGVFDFYKQSETNLLEPRFLKKGLTRREIEIALSMLNNQSYKEISEDFFIAESTVSKHASNIFKKTEVKNRAEFLKRYGT